MLAFAGMAQSTLSPVAPIVCRLCNRCSAWIQPQHTLSSDLVLTKQVNACTKDEPQGPSRKPATHGHARARATSPSRSWGILTWLLWVVCIWTCMQQLPPDWWLKGAALMLIASVVWPACIPLDYITRNCSCQYWAAIMGILRRVKLHIVKPRSPWYRCLFQR